MSAEPSNTAVAPAKAPREWAADAVAASQEHHLAGRQGSSVWQSQWPAGAVPATAGKLAGPHAGLEHAQCA